MVGLLEVITQARSSRRTCVTTALGIFDITIVSFRKLSVSKHFLHLNKDLGVLA